MNIKKLNTYQKHRITFKYIEGVVLQKSLLPHELDLILIRRKNMHNKKWRWDLPMTGLENSLYIIETYNIDVKNKNYFEKDPFNPIFFS